MGGLEDIIKMLDEMKKEIWQSEKAPGEVNALKHGKFIPSGTMPSVIYACFDVANGSTFLVISRELLKDEKNNIRECKEILVKFLLNMSQRYETWGFHCISDLLKDALKCIENADSRDTLIAFVERLLVYNNKLWNWLDMSIPWFDMDKRFELK